MTCRVHPDDDVRAEVGQKLRGAALLRVDGVAVLVAPVHRNKHEVGLLLGQRHLLGDERLADIGNRGARPGLQRQPVGGIGIGEEGDLHALALDDFDVGQVGLVLIVAERRQSARLEEAVAVDEVFVRIGIEHMVMRQIVDVEPQSDELLAGLLGRVERRIAGNSVFIAADECFNVDIAEVRVADGIRHILVQVREIVFAGSERGIDRRAAVGQRGLSDGVVIDGGVDDIIRAGQKMNARLAGRRFARFAVRGVGRQLARRGRMAGRFVIGRRTAGGRPLARQVGRRGRLGAGRAEHAVHQQRRDDDDQQRR